MTECSVVVAAYESLDPALADWEILDAYCRAGELALFDAALVEADRDTVRAFHRHSPSGYGRGSAAGAVVGLLRPPSIVTGAVAGGVGGSTIILLGRAVSRSDGKLLGDVMDRAPIAMVALAIEPVPAEWREILAEAAAVATARLAASSEDLKGAVDADDSDPGAK